MTRLASFPTASPQCQPATPCYTKCAAQLGFASLHAYLADHVTKRAWTLTQVASELGIDRNTVRDRLERHGLRRTRQTAR